MKKRRINLPLKRSKRMVMSWYGKVLETCIKKPNASPRDSQVQYFIIAGINNNHRLSICRSTTDRDKGSENL